MTRTRMVKSVFFSGSEAEADEIIQSHGDSKSLAIWCAMLKRELTEKNVKQKLCGKNMRRCGESIHRSKN